MYMIVERQYMDVKNILYLHKYLCRFSFKIKKEKNLSWFGKQHCLPQRQNTTVAKLYWNQKFQMLFEQNIASNVTRNEESKHIKF